MNYIVQRNRNIYLVYCTYCSFLILWYCILYIILWELINTELEIVGNYYITPWAEDFLASATIELSIIDNSMSTTPSLCSLSITAYKNPKAKNFRSVRQWFLAAFYLLVIVDDFCLCYFKFVFQANAASSWFKQFIIVLQQRLPTCQC